MSALMLSRAILILFWTISNGPSMNGTMKATRFMAGWCLNSWNGYFDTLYGRAIELAEQQRGEGEKAYH